MPSSRRKRAHSSRELFSCLLKILVAAKISAKAPTQIVTQFPSRRDGGAPRGMRNLQYLLLTRVRDYHPADDEVKQGYRINSKSFPVCWLAIPKELYGGCKGKRKMEKNGVSCEFYRKFAECTKVENLMKRCTSCVF